MQLKNCVYCGEIVPKDVNNSVKYYTERKKYCSQRCSGLAVRGRIPWNKGTKGLMPEPANKKPKVPLVCKQCKKDYELVPSLAKRSSFCSHECYWLSLKGTKQPISVRRKKSNKKMGVPLKNGKWVSKEGGRMRLDHKLWRERCLERDKQCTQCQSTDELQVHHIKPWRKYPTLRFAMKNGTVLCKTCHYKSHRKRNLIHR